MHMVSADAHAAAAVARAAASSAGFFVPATGAADA